MNQFTSNIILSNPIYIVYLLIGLTVLFHFLFVWPRNLSKRKWKQVDYIWLTAAAIGLLGIAADVRVTTAKNWVEIKRIRAIGILESLEFITQQPDQTGFCQKFSQSDFSPPNLVDIQRQYDFACEWKEALATKLDKLNKHDVPQFDISDVPSVTFSYDGFSEDISWVLSRVEEYSEQRKVFEVTVEAAELHRIEEGLFYFWPFLLCGALAIRIAKVSGETKYER
jgi:hypothetical protein